jgi:hypothetical protein
MKAQVPAYVFKHGASEKDWVPENDTLTLSDATLPFSEIKQENWWRMNHRIRLAFDDVEKKVKSLIAAGNAPKIHTVSWVQLSKRVDCDRDTLKQPERIHWTKKRKKALEELIKNSKEKVEQKEEETIDAVTASQDRLNKQRSETAHWFERYKEKETIVKELLVELGNKNAKIEELNCIVRALTNKPDNDSKVIKLQ